MHTLFRVTGVLSGVESSVVLGLGFCGWASVKGENGPRRVLRGPFYLVAGTCDLWMSNRSPSPVASRVSDLQVTTDCASKSSRHIPRHLGRGAAFRSQIRSQPRGNWAELRVRNSARR